uniref:Uncharacterized protein n=1 Tax=Anguilla anguilla TaxID=7936 RepID=A0A0E9R2Z9_ANGAN
MCGSFQGVHHSHTTSSLSVKPAKLKNLHELYIPCKSLCVLRLNLTLWWCQIILVLDCPLQETNNIILI